MTPFLRSFSFFSFIFTLFSVACSDPITEEIELGREAVTQGQLQEAHQHFDLVLQQAPKNFYARWGKADVYRREKQYEKEAELLEQILKEDEFQPHFVVLRAALDKNYRARAELEQNPNIIEQLERKAIEQEPASVANAALAERLFEQGTKAQENQQYEIALAHFNEAKSLRISDKLQREIAQKIEAIEFAKFKDDFLTHHANLLKNSIATYDRDQSQFEVSISLSVDYPCNSNCKLAADKAALSKADQKLAKLTEIMAEKNVNEDQTIQYNAAEIQILSKNTHAPSKAKQREKTQKNKAEYSLTLAVPLDAVLFQAYKLKQ